MQIFAIEAKRRATANIDRLILTQYPEIRSLHSAVRDFSSSSQLAREQMHMLVKDRSYPIKTY
jgi:hypothetical protein